MIFLQSYVITLAGRLLETGNKRIGRISGVKSGRGRLRNLPSGPLGENFWEYLTDKQKGYFQGGHLREGWNWNFFVK